MYRKILIALLICVIATTQSFAHPGNTDSRGGHCVGGAARDGSCPSGNYHFHNSGDDDDADTLVIVGGIIVGLVLFLWLFSKKTYYLVDVEDGIDMPIEPTYDIETNTIGVKYKLEF